MRPPYKYLKFFFENLLKYRITPCIEFGIPNGLKNVLVSDLTACYVFNNFKALKNVVLQVLDKIITYRL